MYGKFVMHVVHGDRNGQVFMSHYDENWISHTLFIIVLDMLVDIMVLQSDVQS